MSQAIEFLILCCAVFFMAATPWCNPKFGCEIDMQGWACQTIDPHMLQIWLIAVLVNKWINKTFFF